MAYKEITSAVNEPPVSLPAQGRPNTLYANEAGGSIEFDPNGNGSWVTLGAPTKTQFLNFSSAVDIGNNAGENIDVYKRDTGDKLMVVNFNNDNVYISEDGGMNWSPVSTGSGQGQICIVMVTESIWVVGGLGGVIYRTTDGGSTWSSISTGTTDEITAMGIGNGVIMAGGQNGVLLRSTDDGASFSSVTSGISTQYLEDATYRDGTWIICGDGGTILRSTDDGQTWTTITTPNANVFLQVDKGVNNWVASDLDGFAIRSTDDGQTWSAISHPLATGGTIGCIAKNDMFILGNGATDSSNVFVSQDDGFTFHLYSNSDSTGSFSGFCEWYAVRGDGAVAELDILEL